MALTPKQDKFCQEIIKGENQSDAYRKAYDAKNMTDKTITEAASRLMADSNVTARLAELRQPIIEKCQETAADLIRELNELKLDAHADKQYAPAISAVMGKAKLLGYDKNIIEGNVTVTVMEMVSKDGKPLKYNIGKELKK